MKFLITVTLGICLAMLATIALAASLGDVVEPLEQGEFSITSEYTHVFDRDLDAASTEVDEYDQIYANLSYGVAENLKLYTKLGMADMNIKGITSANEITKEGYESGFLWGGGISSNTRLEDGWIIGFAGEYTAWDTDLDAVTVNGASGTNLTGKLSNSEWQLALYGGKEISFIATDMTLLPYVGIKYAKLECEYDGLSFSTSSASYVGTGTAKNDTEAGVVVGINLRLNEQFKANIEGQFIDETGVTAGLTYKF